MKDIDIVELVISATPGVHIGECMKAGIELAAKEWRNIRLRHNGKIYSIKPNDLIASITEIKADQGNAHESDIHNKK